MIGIVLGGDFNRNGMKELRPRLHHFGLRPVFGDRVATHDKGKHLDDIFTNLKLVKKSVDKIKFASDHFLL